MNAIARRMFNNDYAACLALADQRKAENAELRRRAQANKELEADLRETAARRGEVFSWHDYFRNAGWL